MTDRYIVRPHGNLENTHVIVDTQSDGAPLLYGREAHCRVAADYLNTHGPAKFIADLPEIMVPVDPKEDEFVAVTKPFRCAFCSVRFESVERRPACPNCGTHGVREIVTVADGRSCDCGVGDRHIRRRPHREGCAYYAEGPDHV